MKKSEAINTFAQGLVMDINPLVAPNDGVCNALNATLITMNGNENVLQNDMGNGRVETAFLPEGYVPLGTTELGGIIYIVSYNPLNKKCQIGSFPSPERNISTDKISNLNQTLDNTDFKYDPQTDPQTGAQIGTQTGALVYYLKKELNEGLTFNPGDKFIVYGDTIDANFANLYDEASYTPDKMSTAKNYTLKLDIGTVTDTGKLVKFENLKQYNITYKDSTDPTKEIQGTYHIFQYSGEDTQNPDLDEYRSLVSQPYNIFSSKISGSLVLIAELVQFNDFDISLKHAFTTSETHKVYTPKATFTFSGDYPFIPMGAICEVSLMKGTNQIATSTFDYIIPDEDIYSQLSKDNTLYEVELEAILKDSVLTEIQAIAESGYFDTGERNEGYVIKYTFTPCMNWGPVSYLAVTGQIDLDKLGTGYIDISQWRYYNEPNNEPNKCNLTWGLEIYEEEGYSVSQVEMEFTRFTTPSQTETITYKINNKASYSGVFYDILPINEDYYRLTGRLKSNCLYLVKVKVTYTSTNGQSEIREFYRWLYTNTVFNQRYTDTTDFKDLSLDFTPNFKVNYNTSSIETKSQAYGIIKQVTEGLSNDEKDAAKDTKSSLSAIQTKKDFSIQGDLVIGLAQDYNTFCLKVPQNAFDLELDNDSFKGFSTSAIKYSDLEDSNQDEYLKSEDIVVEKEGLSDYIISTSSGQDISDNLLEIPTNVVEKGVFKLESFNNNIYTFSIAYSTLQMVKAYCTKVISAITYKGKFIPLAYNRSTFQDYNLEWDNTIKKWLPFNVGLFGFKENKGDKGIAWIGGWNKSGGDSDQITVEIKNNLNFHWTTDSDIPPAQSETGWSGTSMFFIHKWSADNADRLRYISEPIDVPQRLYPTEDKTIYSHATDNSSYSNRIQLSFRSNKEDEFFYPINCSVVGTGNNITSTMIQSSPFNDLFNDFAQYLNNIYRYDSEEVSQEYIIPQSIYWMDECQYSSSMSLNIRSTEKLNDSNIYLMLEEGEIGLSSIIDTLISKNHLESKEYPTLINNISNSLQSIDDKFTFNIINSDNTSGIEIRNYMLNCMAVTTGTAIMDYNGTSIIGNSSTQSNSNMLYMRYNVSGEPNIIIATKFIPKKINYFTEPVGNDYEVTPSITNDNLDDSSGQELNLNRYFTLNNQGMIILKDPKTSEYKFERRGADDNGIADGYLKVCILHKYKSY